MKKETEKELDDKTPKWFRYWHAVVFTPRLDTSDTGRKRNERLIYIILAAIIASNLVGNGNGEELVSLIKSLIGG